MQIFYFLFTLLFAAFSAGQLGRISFFRQEVNIYFYEIFLVITLGVLFLKYRLKPFITYKQSFKFLFLFLLYLLFSYLLSIFYFSLYQNEVALLYYLRLASYLIFFIYFFYFIERKPVFAETIFKLTIFFAGVVICTSIVQYFLYPDLRNLFYEGWDPHLYRLVGVFLEPPISGGIYGILFYYLLMKYSSKQFIVGYLILPLLCIFILLTFSRGTYLGFLVSGLYYLLSNINRKNLFKKINKGNNIWYGIVIFVIIVSGIYLATKSSGEGAHLTRVSTVASRLVNFEEAFSVWEKHPIFGVGYNHIRYARDVKQANYGTADALSHADATFHSSFLTILVSSGIFGLVLFIAMLVEVARRNKFATVVILFLSVCSLTDNVLLHPFILFFATVLIASCSVTRLSDR